jgi:hypothetical protein
VTKVQFSKSALGAIGATLPSSTDPARSALLPEILRAWAAEDLREHLSQESRIAARQRENRLKSVGARAQRLIEAIEALDETGTFEIAVKPEMRRAGTSLWETDISAANQRRDSAISWLVDLIEIFNGSANHKGPKSPPDKATRYYLIIRDLAAIFELVGGEKPTRRVEFDSGKTYGPFSDFVTSVWVQIFGNRRGLSYAVRVWADEMARQRKLAEADVRKAVSLLSRDLTDAERDAIEKRFRAYSPFVANIQFRHPDLWRKIRRTPP